MTHDELAESLATHLRGSTSRMVWTDLKMGSANSKRPDVFTLDRSFNLSSCAYEVKVSVADFRADITSGKWLAYRQFASRVFFATPAGLVSRDDIPAGCGWVVRNEDGAWRTMRRPTVSPQPPLGSDVWMKLLMDGIDREIDRRFRDRPPRSEWDARERALKVLGDETGKLLADRNNSQARLRAEIAATEANRAWARADYAEIQQELSENLARTTAQIAETLGLPPDTNHTEVLVQLRKRHESVRTSDQHIAVQREVKHAIKILSRLLTEPEGSNT